MCLNISTMACGEGLGHGGTRVSLRDTPRTPSSPKLDSGRGLWDSAESDTESLAQERAYQQALQDRLDLHTDAMTAQPNEEDVDSLEEEEEEEEEEREEEGLCVYDSLEVAAAHRLYRRTSSLSSVEGRHGYQTRDNKVCRLASSDDSYADLRYDPDWRTNLRGGRWPAAPLLSPTEDPRNAGGRDGEREDGPAPARGGRHRYVVTESPPALAPNTEGGHFESPHPLESYRLHGDEAPPPRDAPSPPSPRRGTPEATPPRTHTPPRERGPGEAVLRNAQARRVEPDLTYADRNTSGFSEADDRYRETAARERHAREGETGAEGERGETGESGGRERPTQSLSKTKSRVGRKTDKPREDIIERNKMTLGVNALKQGGSYLKAHSQKGETNETSRQATDLAEEISDSGGTSGSLEDHSDPELRWLQKTKQLKVTQASRERRGRRGGGNPPDKRPKAGQRGACLSPLAPPKTDLKLRPPALAQAPPPLGDGDSSSRSSGTPRHARSRPVAMTTPPPPPPLPPPAAAAIHLNIHLSAASDQLGFLRRGGGQNAVVTMTTPRGPTTLVTDGDDPRPLAALPPGSGAGTGGGPGRAGLTQGRRGEGGADVQTNVWHQNQNQNQNHTSPRPAVARWVSQDRRSYEEEDHHGDESSHSYRPPVRPGSYTLLPPIGTSMTGHAPPERSHASPERGHAPPERSHAPIQRSCSDGYLAQMDKQKQLRDQISYKAYTLKDYKRLKQEVNLGGLGPDRMTSEITVEKMRRRRLYSDVIRQQNRKRIPVQPMRNPEDGDRKEQVPREKALEYAKSIVRPPPPPKPRGAGGPGGGELHRPLDGLDLHPSQLATLAFLRRRHEEEKQAVARFKALHAV